MMREKQNRNNPKITSLNLMGCELWQVIFVLRK